MSGTRVRGLGVWLLAIVIAGGCRCGPAPFEVLSARALASQSPVSGLDDAALEAWLTEALHASPLFRQPVAGRAAKADAPERGVRLELDLGFEQVREDPEGRGAVVVVALGLRLRRVEDGLSVHDTLDALLTAPLQGASPREVARSLVQAAIPELVLRASRQLEAARKTPDALVADLANEDPGVREGALRILVERRDPRAFLAVARELEGSDPLALRRAIGMTVELGDRRAVPLLIVLAQDRAEGVLREVLFALGILGGEEARAYLFTLASGHDSPEVRAIAEEALREASGHTR